MDDKEKTKALKAITALRQLDGLDVITFDEKMSVMDKIMAKYGKYLSPLRKETT